MKAKHFYRTILGLVILIVFSIAAYHAVSWTIEKELAETPSGYAVKIPVSSKYIIQPNPYLHPAGFIVGGFSADSIVSLANESQTTLLIGWKNDGYVNYYLQKEGSYLYAQAYFGDVAKNWDYVFEKEETKTELKGIGTSQAFFVFYPQRGSFQLFSFFFIWAVSIIAIYWPAKFFWRELKILVGPSQKAKLSIV